MFRTRPTDLVARSGSLRELLLAVASRDTEDDHLASLAVRARPAEVVEACRRHRVVAVVHERLRRVDGIGPDLVDELARVRMAAQIHCLMLEQARSVIGAVLDVPWLLLKGDVLAQWYDNPGVRDFNDLDVLVRPSDFRRALDSLATVGILPLSENWQGFLDYGVGEVPIANGRAVIDLHWHVVALGEARRHLRLPTEDLMDRAVAVRVGGADASALDPTDTLLHLCVNTGLDGGRWLRGLIDVDVLVRSGRIDFDDFARRARDAGAGRVAAALLQRSQTLIGTPVPSGLLPELSPWRRWLLVNRLVDRSGVIVWRTGSGISPGLLLSSGRESSTATAIACGRSLARMAASALGRPALTRPGGPLDWQRMPANGDADRSRRTYLDWVERQQPRRKGRSAGR